MGIHKLELIIPAAVLLLCRCAVRRIVECVLKV